MTKKNTKPMVPYDADFWWFCELTTARLRQMMDDEEFKPFWPYIKAALKARNNA